MQPEPSHPAGSQFDFIMNAGQQPKKSAFGGWLPSGNSKRQRIIIFGVIAAGLIVVFGVLFSFLFGSGGTQKDVLTDLAKEQAEIIRVATLGTGKAKSPDVQSLAMTTKLSITTAHQQTLEVLEKAGRKLDEKDLATGKNSKTDELLESAEKNNRFDEAFSKELLAELATYQKNVKKAFDSATAKKERSVLSVAYKQVGVLLLNTE